MRKLTNFNSLLISSILFLIFTSLFAADIKIVSITALCLSALPAVWFLISLLGLIRDFINGETGTKNALVVVLGLFLIFIISYFGVRNLFWVHTEGYVSVTENNVYVKDNQAYFIIDDIHYEVSNEVYEELNLHVNFEYDASWNRLDRGYSKHLELNID